MQVFDAAIQAESGQSRASKASLEPVIDVFFSMNLEPDPQNLQRAARIKAVMQAMYIIVADLQ